MCPSQCLVAPQIGYGCKAKPILLELECDSRISEAWLNGTGTLLAVVGTENSAHEERAQVVQTVLKNKKVTPKELQGDIRDKAAREFLSGSGWLRARGGGRTQQAGIRHHRRAAGATHQRQGIPQ